MAKKPEIVGFGETPLDQMNFQQMMDAGVIDIAEIDDVTVVDQAELVGIPFILFDWEIKPSQEYGGDYAVCRVKTASGTSVFSDGGSGICDALERYKAALAETDTEKPLLYFHFGLRASTYQKQLTDSDTGETRSMTATTYYFDNRRRP